MCHDASHIDGKMLKAEQRQRRRRLAGLGILAHQPAIAAYCKVTEEEKTTVINIILQQQVQSIANIVKQIVEPREAEAAVASNPEDMATRGVSAPGEATRPQGKSY